MDNTTKQVMKQTLQPQTTVVNIHTIIIEIDSGENTDYEQWLTNTIDNADDTIDINDFTDPVTKEIDYDGYYRAVYNELKQVIEDRLNYAVDQWIAIDQPIIS